MNKKLQKVLEEIEKTETKITQWQDHLKLLLIQKKQLEDTEILKSIRSMKLESWELLQVLEKLQKGEFQLLGMFTKIHARVIFRKRGNEGGNKW